MFSKAVLRRFMRIPRQESESMLEKIELELLSKDILTKTTLAKTEYIFIH